MGFWAVKAIVSLRFPTTKNPLLCKRKAYKSDFATDSNNFDMPRKRREGGAGQKGEKVSVFQAFGQ